MALRHLAATMVTLVLTAAYVSAESDAERCQVEKTYWQSRVAWTGEWTQKKKTADDLYNSAQRLFRLAKDEADNNNCWERGTASPACDAMKANYNTQLANYQQALTRVTEAASGLNNALALEKETFEEYQTCLRTGEGFRSIQDFGPPRHGADAEPGPVTNDPVTVVIPPVMFTDPTVRTNTPVSPGTVSSGTNSTGSTTTDPNVCNPKTTLPKTGLPMMILSSPKFASLPSPVPSCESKPPFLPWGGNGSATITVSGGMPCGVGWHNTGATILDSMSVTSTPSHGSLKQQDPHVIIFTPALGYKGQDSFTLEMQEHNGGRRATLRVKVSVTIQ
jgi:hypothetical protein